MHKVSQFNNKLAQRITDIVSTMWCAYVFALLAFLSLPAAIQSHSLIVIVGWIAQTFLQLVLLSVIMVGQKIQTDVHLDTQDKLVVHHNLLKEVHKTLKEIK